ncbi:MAG TPA: hypothetical protein DEG69_04930 [Flavobacteriaceae bacterium]|nr:hypothetical protein [Flavobacteriaceae bacterium]
MSSILKIQQQYKRVYHELANGYSTLTYDKKEVFVKHVSEYDLGALELYAEAHHKEAQKKGLPNEEEKIKLLIDNGIWLSSNEEKIKNLIETLGNLQDTHKKLFLKKQLKQNQKKIDDTQDTLQKLLAEKEELVGLTCEKYAERKSNEEIVYHCFFKDSGLSEKLFSRIEFEELHHIKLYDLIKEYNIISNRFSYSEMQRLAALPFFANLFFMVDDDPTKFYGKSVIKLTACQIELFNISKVYKSVVHQGNSPPMEFYEDVDKLVSFYESYTGSKDIKEATNKDGQSIVGASIEEMKTMTKGQEGTESVQTLQKAFKKVESQGKKVDELSLEEIAEMHGY